jgi:GNAT superfamily N-acetyltransferase
MLSFLSFRSFHSFLVVALAVVLLTTTAGTSTVAEVTTTGTSTVAENASSSSSSLSVAELELEIPWPSGIVIDRVVGPDGAILRYGRLQYNAVSFRPQWQRVGVAEGVLSAARTAALVAQTEEYAHTHGWSRNRHVDYGLRPTKDLPARQLFSTPAAFAAFTDELQARIWPVFSNVFGINASLLRIDDLFVTKYTSTSATENALAPHLDKSPWSFVVALNDDYEGGGTVFVDSRRRWRAPAGAAILFNGKQLHAGE